MNKIAVYIGMKYSDNLIPRYNKVKLQNSVKELKGIS